jgi:hypothetical protein
VQTDCTSWLGQVIDAVPTVVLAAKVGEENVFEVNVTMDGNPLATQLDGKPIEVDPGLHTFVFERVGNPSVEKKTIVSQRDKGQLVSVSWPAKAAATPAPSPELPVEKERPVPPLFYVLSGTTVAGFATFAVLGLMGESTKSDLESSCSPHCSTSEVSSLETRFIVADVAVGIGAASALGALVVFLTRPEQDKPHASVPAVSSVGLKPIPGGAALQWHGAF